MARLPEWRGQYREPANIVNRGFYPLQIKTGIVRADGKPKYGLTTVDVMTTRLAAGDSKEGAASFAYKTVALPMLTGSFVTAAGFIPIGFARSSAGEYTFSIFAVVSYALILSWIVAVLFAPLLGVVILSKPKAKPSNKPSAILAYFRRFLVAAMRWRWLTIGATLAGFVAAILASPYIPRQFFPPSDRPDLLVDLTLPQNASIFASESAADRLDRLLKGDPDVGHWSTYVGRGAIRFYLPLDVQLPNNFFREPLQKPSAIDHDIVCGGGVGA